MERKLKQLVHATGKLRHLIDQALVELAHIKNLKSETTDPELISHLERLQQSIEDYCQGLDYCLYATESTMYNDYVK